MWISYAEFEATAMEDNNEDLAEDDLEDYLKEQKKQCIQGARSKPS